MSAVSPAQRFTKRNPCPICEGGDSDRRHRSERCWGYLSDDGRYAHCTREEYSGTLPQLTDQTYAHRLDAPCRCGHAHGNVTPIQRPITPVMPAKAPTWQRGPFPKTLRLDGGVTVTLAVTYTYCDATNAPAYSILRYNYSLQPGQAKPDKTFRQVRHQDATTWAWGLGDTERLLYRLPDLLAASATRPVFIGEGEKAAEALIALGMVATTCSEGAEKWQQVPGRQDALRNRHVVILPDNDETGKGHAQQVAADLAGVAASALIVALPGLPEHGDVVEWIANGGTKDDLYELVIATSMQNVLVAKSDTSTDSTALRVREEALRKENVKRRELEQQEQWTSKLFASTHLSPNQKLIARAVCNELANKKVDEQGELTIYLPTLAKHAGVSTQTAGEALKKLDECKAINRRVESRIGTGGQKVSRITISPTALFATPDKIVPPKPRNHGGKRCPHCGGHRFQVEQIVTCADCGTVIKREKRIIEESVANLDAMPLDGPFTGSQFDLLNREASQIDRHTEGNATSLDIMPTEEPVTGSQIDLHREKGSQTADDTGEDVCTVCRSPDIEVYSPSGVPYCAEHIPRERQQMTGGAA